MWNVLPAIADRLLNLAIAGIKVGASDAEALGPFKK